MKGLLLKDFYTLLKQSKIFVFLIVFFAFVPGFSTSTMAIVYAAMLPVTALAYDERAKWDSLAAMMPYSARDLVCSKYVMGYVSIAAAAVLTAAAQLAIGAIRRAPAEPEAFLSLVFGACAAVVILAVNLPVMFKFGVERGRIAFFILIGGTVAVTMVLSDRLPGLLASMPLDSGPAALLLVAVAVAGSAVSIAASVALYRRRAA